MPMVKNFSENKELAFFKDFCFMSKSLQVVSVNKYSACFGFNHEFSSFERIIRLEGYRVKFIKRILIVL